MKYFTDFLRHKCCKKIKFNKLKHKVLMNSAIEQIYFPFLAFGWCISCFCLIQLPIWAIYAVIKQEEKTWSKKIINAFKPNSNWGPNDAVKSKLHQKDEELWK